MSFVERDATRRAESLRVQLNVHDAAQLLQVSTKTIYRWVADGKIPGYRVSHALRFDRTELLEWATAHRIAVAPATPPEPADAAPLPTFAEALLAGGIHHHVEGADRDEVLANVVRVMRLDHEEERDLVAAALRAREDLASTAIGDGFALPHLRNPVRFHIARPSVTLCFLERAVPWGAPDRSPVDTLLAVVGGTVRAVLRTHSRCHFALRDPAFREAVRERRSRETIHAAAAALDLAPP